MSGFRWHSEQQSGAEGAGRAGVHSPLTRAGRAALKVGAPPEGRWSRDAKGAYPRPSLVASPMFGQTVAFLNGF